MRLTRRINYAASIGFVVIALASCGGGGDGGRTPTAPVDNSVGRIDLSPASPATLVSGTTTTLSATAFTKDNRSLGTASVAWASSNEAVASVSAGTVTAKLVGTAVITATSGSVSSAGVSVTVTAGAAAQLALRTQPAGATSGAALATQPAVEVRDAAGNVIATATATITAALASGGGTLSGPVTATVVSGVAMFSGLTITGTIGARTLTFSALGLTSGTSATFNLGAGVVSQLVIATQPVAGTAYAAFTTPAVVQFRDASGNTAPSTASVTVAIAFGGGTLGGAATVNAVAGAAMFSTLTVNGTAGPRTLTFSSSGLTPVTSASFNVTTAPPAIIGLSPSPATISTVTGQNPAAVNVAISNTGVFPLTNLRVQSISYSPIAPAGWLATTFLSGSDAPATIRLTATSAAFAIGTYTASVVIAGDGAATTATLTVTLTVAPTVTNTYGTTASKVSVVNIGASISPGLVTTTDGAVSTTDPTVTFSARSPALATVNAAGRITAVSAGQAWVAALSTQANADSVLVIVPYATGPVLKSDLTKLSYAVGDTITIRVQLDTRGLSVGAVTATATWPVWTGSTGVSGSMTFVDITTTGSPMAPVTTVDQTVNVIRIHGASAAGVTGTVLLATVRLRVARRGLTGVYLNASELLGADFTNLLPTATFTQYPVIVP
ncbi:hypothetical protein LBMAG44_00250 [Gemmatimonadota bacterium]|nr:hypothetical protein LBMAG44_00250 [Gemmatimonadota bacterium]